MEPQLPQVNLQPEEQPSPPVMPEQSADIPNSGPEALIETPEVAKNTEKTSE